MHPHQELHSILFDIGNVLIDWDPRHLYRKIFVTEDGQPDDTKITWFLDTICTMAWNVTQDRGRSIAAANRTFDADQGITFGIGASVVGVALQLRI